MNLKRLSISQLALVTGKDRRTVSERVIALPFEMDGKAKMYSAPDAVQAILDGAGGAPAELDLQIKEESLRLERGRADKVTLEVEQTRGELVAIEDVTKEVAKEYTRVRAALLSIPTRMAKPLSMETDPARVQEILHEAVVETLEHLSADVEDDEEKLDDELEGETGSDQEDDPTSAA
jgi:phage terminase Nu1 subunit (DNA packaging protein)